MLILSLNLICCRPYKCSLHIIRFYFLLFRRINNQMAEKHERMMMPMYWNHSLRQVRRFDMCFCFCCGWTKVMNIFLNQESYEDCGDRHPWYS